MASAMLAANLFITPQLPGIQNVGLKSAPEPVKEEVKAPPSACELDIKSIDCVKELIKRYSAEYEVSEKLAMKVAFCESDFRADVYGDGGKAFGTYQFHKPTFEMFSKKFGEKLDYYDNEHNIKLAIWALSKDKGHHWTCYRRIAAK